MKKTKALLISYLSGYFDGEGCIYTRSEKKKRHGNLSLAIDSRYDRKPLDLMKSIFGGNVIIRWSNRDQKCFFHWYSQDSAKIRKALKLMLPFLKTKKFQAQQGIRLAERILVRIRKRKGKLSNHEKYKRAELCLKIKTLKRMVPNELIRAETKRKNNVKNVEAIVQASRNRNLKITVS